MFPRRGRPQPLPIKDFFQEMVTVASRGRLDICPDYVLWLR
jgi:hypothetical protein